MAAGSAQTPIQGLPQVDAETMTRFVARHNPSFDPSLARMFIDIGRRYGIRGDVALCQAILETGWFRFADGTAVCPSQYNYCGLGVTRGGMKGAAFESMEQGVTAMMQHLFAYCTTAPLPDDDLLVDPRFSLVARGSATTWEDLSGRWAANPEYGSRILKIYRNLLDSVPEVAPVPDDETDVLPADESATEISHSEIFH